MIDLRCYSLFSESGMAESQPLGPDLFVPCARDARGRFAKGSSGNPRGRPRGLPNPKRRVPDLVARPLSAQALSDLLDRKPHLLRPLMAQLLPPPLATVDPAERLGIDLPAIRTAEDMQRLARRVWAAVSDGELGPIEAARLVRRGRAQYRAVRRATRLARRLRLTAGANPR